MIADDEESTQRIAEALVSSTPRVLWIELTSKCPFDCLFCSRKTRHGSSQHLDFDLFRGLLAALSSPEAIRLNYSGESTHYPHFREAVALAAATEATTELVSALASAPSSAIQAMVGAGLHRLSVSLHAIDAVRYGEIYRFGGISALEAKLSELQLEKGLQGRTNPAVDFAFVAMERNLDQLDGVARLARREGSSTLSVHPVIRRDANLPAEFPAEIASDGRIRPAFWESVVSAVNAAQAAVPEVRIEIARWPPGPPAGGFPVCEQNPWETAHILADGSVVPCEVQDRTVLGNLRRQTLAEIWHGPLYGQFRRDYLSGANTICSACEWRTAARQLTGQAVLARGWHPTAQGETLWSQREAAIVLPDLPPSTIHLKALLPANPNNEVRLHHDGHTHSLAPSGEGLHTVTWTIRASKPGEVLRLETRRGFVPVREGWNEDFRTLGVALLEFRVEPDERRSASVRRLLGALRNLDRWTHRPPSRLPSGPPPPDGVCVLIPARGWDRVLEDAIRSALRAVERLGQACPCLVSLSGVPRVEWAAIRAQYPNVEWILSEEPRTFLSAVRHGLGRARTGWVYLLNSDMNLDEDALSAAAALRAHDVFAIGSRIRMVDGSRTETNWTQLRRTSEGLADLVELDPGDARGPQCCFYAGGGSGLFQRRLLRRFVRSSGCYEPFYWEDVEWGARAAEMGYRSIFCPDSRVEHIRRHTARQFYSEREIERVFDRNRLLFQLRNLREWDALQEPLTRLAQRSWAEIFSADSLAGLVRARLRRWV